MDIRIGQGFDIHALVQGRACILGGVKIPFELGCAGHSDADPLTHAVIDALLGAAGLGDIGEHFPDHDPRYKDVKSTLLLEEVVNAVLKDGWSILNLDASVLAEAPKLAAHKPRIKANLAQYLGIPQEQVNIKAKTMEGFDAVGRNQAIAVHCNLLLMKASGF